jgi:hypothetical protein
MERIIKSIIYIVAGIAIGDVTYPYIQMGLSRLASGQPWSMDILINQASLWRILIVLQFAMMLLTVACLFGAESRSIVRGNRSTNVPAFLWGLLLFLNYFFVGQIFGVAYFAVQDWFNGSVSAYTLYGTVGAVVYLCALYIVTKVVRGGTSISAERENKIPRWLLAA